MIFSVCVLILAFLAFRFFTDKPEPRYHGISLTAWLCTYDSYFSSSNFPTMAQMDQAADAVRHIGTNALPFLLRWISDEPAPWRRKARSALEKLPHPFHRLGLLTDARMGPKSDLRHRLALYGFIVLGPDAAPAIPALKQFQAGFFRYSPDIIISAGLALDHVQGGQRSLDMATLSDDNSPPLLRAFAAHRIALLEPKSPRVRSALVKALQDQDFIVRYHATNELRRIAPEMLETNAVSAH
jgi:hypothetical protein